MNKDFLPEKKGYLAPIAVKLPMVCEGCIALSNYKQGDDWGDDWKNELGTNDLEDEFPF